MNIPAFADKRDLFAFLRQNKEVLIAEKKYSVKHADATVFNPVTSNVSGDVIKSASGKELLDIGKMNIKAVINTTGLMDSHSDVHIKGLWNKSIKEQKGIYLLEEHRMSFKGIISDTVKASVADLDWSEVGMPYAGKTEALVFDASLELSRNPYMFEQYAKGYVKNHSVGMRYVKIFMAVNSEDKYWIDEKDVWEKYIDQVANREDADEKGYFFAVTEAKVVEGSAVPMGSNIATPTLEISEAADKGTFNNEPTQVTQTEQLKFVKLNFD